LLSQICARIVEWLEPDVKRNVLLLIDAKDVLLLPMSTCAAEKK
jgi:hypothetical protein